jgi:hypothetical protein
MEDPVIDKCTVQIIVNGDDTRTVVFPLSSTIDVDFVEKEMRSTCNVAHGTLSSSSQQPVVVYTLVAGETYYFLEFTAQGNSAEKELNMADFILYICGLILTIFLLTLSEQCRNLNLT